MPRIDNSRKSPLHQTARKYAEAGLPVFPCISNEQGKLLSKRDKKKPACEHGVKDATTDLEQIDRWWSENPSYNIGLPPDECGWGVIDVEGHAAPDWASRRGLELPPTYTVRTPSGGKHYYYEGEVPNRVRTLIKGAEVDLRGNGGYVLVPPSVVDDKPYVREIEIDPAPMPQWVFDSLKDTKPVEAAPAVDLDLPGNIVRAIKHVRALTPVREGRGADEATYKAATTLRDLGISEAKALEILTDHFDLEPRDHRYQDFLARKILNAYKYGQNVKGAYAVGNAADVFAASPLVKPARPDGPVPFSDLLKRSVGPVKEIVPGLIEKGIVTLLAGPGGVHKSRTAVQWGLCLAAGAPIYGRAVEQCTFMHLSYEDHPDEVARRAQKITQRLKLPADTPAYYWDQYSAAKPLAIVSDSEFSEQPFWGELRTYLRSIRGHKFVVADSAYNILQFTGAAKINEAAVKGAIEALGRFCTETDSTMLALWHPSQAGQERGDASGWSVAWHNAPRARLSLTAVKDTDSAFDLKVEKRNNGPKGKPITLYWSDGVLLPRTEVDAAQQGSLFTEACIQTAILAAEQGAPIQKQKGLFGWHIDEIERHAGFRPTPAAVKAELAQAVFRGRLRYIKAYGKTTAGYFPIAAEIDGTLPPKHADSA